MIVRKALCTVLVLCVIGSVATGQASQKKQSLVVNGHSGEAIVYQIDGRSFVDLETLVRIGNGSMSFRAEKIVLTFPLDTAAPPPAPPSQPANAGMSSDFRRAAVAELANIQDWVNVIVYAIQRGIPGDGSRIVVLHDRAAESLRQAQVSATTSDDQGALQLLTNNFNELNKWSGKLIHERKSMDTGKYSLSPDALNNDASYQKITNCSKFLGTMIPSEHFTDDASCH